MFTTFNVQSDTLHLTWKCDFDEEKMRSNKFDSLPQQNMLYLDDYVSQ
ncbi:hypothetical protein Lalb_Chr24g0399461 [Lupinus albus]|uniref:Uncharacterized protein n=1 Tax=Lupinus albus TaxID=3870 RepID=A0A6A4N844_LUPAL|nr:hypothetical protein Lalb_Chr24g0399461 [Lupinus albus]